MNRKKIYPLYLALIPAVVFFIFFIVPSTVGYYYAFTNWSAARTTNLKFVGFENIMSVLTSTKVPVAFVNTLIYAGVKTITVTLLGTSSPNGTSYTKKTVLENNPYLTDVIDNINYVLNIPHGTYNRNYSSVVFPVILVRRDI